MWLVGTVSDSSDMEEHLSSQKVLLDSTARDHTSSRLCSQCLVPTWWNLSSGLVGCPYVPGHHFEDKPSVFSLRKTNKPDVQMLLGIFLQHPPLLPHPGAVSQPDLACHPIKSYLVTHLASPIVTLLWGCSEWNGDSPKGMSTWNLCN